MNRAKFEQGTSKMQVTKPLYADWILHLTIRCLYRYIIGTTVSAVATLPTGYGTFHCITHLIPRKVVSEA
jgi:hypothetical protein